MSLDENYKPEKALEILWEVCKSSAVQIRVKLLEFLITQKSELSTSRIAEALKLGKGTVQKELSILWNMGIVLLRKEETRFPDKFYDYWELNILHPFVEKYVKRI